MVLLACGWGLKSCGVVGLCWGDPLRPMMVGVYICGDGEGGGRGFRGGDKRYDGVVGV